MQTMAPKRSKPNPPAEEKPASDFKLSHDQHSDDAIVESAFASRYISGEIPKARCGRRIATELIIDLGASDLLGACAQHPGSFPYFSISMLQYCFSTELCSRSGSPKGTAIQTKLQEQPFTSNSSTLCGDGAGFQRNRCPHISLIN